MKQDGVTAPGGTRSDGLIGEPLSIEDLAAIDLFQGARRAFKVKLGANLGGKSDGPEPGIRAVVRRAIEAGEVICRAGDYGSTAFLLLEGTAVAEAPGGTTPRGVPGRTRRSIAALRRMFSRRAAGHERSDLADIGEISRHGVLGPFPSSTPTRLGPGDFFGIDACINFYPRERTVRAQTPVVILEMLRSVVDSIREAGTAGAKLDAAYREAAIRSSLTQFPLFRDLAEGEIEALAAHATLLTPGSDEVRDGVIFAEGEPAEAIFVVRSGTVQLSRPQSSPGLVLTYVSGGGGFGLEPFLPSTETTKRRLVCLSHPDAIAPVEIGDRLTLGRSAACDVVLSAEDRSISRLHCRFEVRDGDLYLIDVDSPNLTLLNGERIRESIVFPGDQVTIVDFTFRIEAIASEGTEKPATRAATASGLDNFEVVRLPVAAVREIFDEEQGFRELAGRARRSGSLASERTGVDPALVDDFVELGLFNSQNVLLIDLDRCTRCDECVRACADAHGGTARFTRDGPRFGKYLVTMACRSCTDPKCMIGCPVGSIRRRDSLEIHIEDWCIGCERCANQCPFGNINMVELAAPARETPEPERTPLRATVCDLCSGYQGPSCVYACPHDAAIRIEPGAFLTPEDRR